VGVRVTPGVRDSGKLEPQSSGLCAWATSEEEPKPKRGSWNDFTVVPGAWYAKTLEPSRER